ncbi:MAG: SCP2 sterol-binding domain-containing protein, partial [Deltaproteobacteria bacterium]
CQEDLSPVQCFQGERVLQLLKALTKNRSCTEPETRLTSKARRSLAEAVTEPSLKSGKLQREREEKDMALTTVKEVFEKMPTVFNPSSATGLNAIFQFHITGDEAGNWHVTVKESTCEITEGIHDNPTVSLTMADADWIAMCNGELDGMSAFMSGKLKATGDIMMAQRIPSLFPL